MPVSRDLSVLGIGSLPFDCLVYLSPDGREIESVETPGGSVGNVLCALCLLGARPAIASVVGEDAEGRRTVEHLRGFGVDTRRLVRKTGCRSRRVRIEIREREEGPPAHRFVHAPVGKSVVSLRDLNPEAGWVRKALETFAWFHFDATTRTARQLARHAAARGKIVSYDFGRPPLWGIAPALDLIESCAVLKTNRPLVPALVEENDPARLFSRFPRLKALLVTDGEKEAELWWRTHQGVERAVRPITRVSRFVDTVGTGDACTAFLIHAVWEAVKAQESEAARQVGDAAGIVGALSLPGGFTLRWAESVLRDLTAFAALVCQFPGATGYLHWLQSENRSLREILDRIAEDGAVPDSFHVSASDFARRLAQSASPVKPL